MGNTQSAGRSPRAENNGGPLDGTQHEQPLPAATHQEEGNSPPPQRAASRRQLFPNLRHSAIFDTVRRRDRDSNRQSRPPERSHENYIPDSESSAARPVVYAEETEHIPESSDSQLRRSLSTASRLGSRLLPDNVMRGLLSSGEETSEEGEALRQGTSRRRRPSVFERRPPSSSNDGLPLGNTFRRRRGLRLEASRSIRAPFSFSRNEHQRLQPDDEEPATHILEADSGTASSSPLNLSRRRSRLTRVRHSLHLPVTGLFGSSRNRASTYFTRSATPASDQEVTDQDPMSLSSPFHSIARGELDRPSHEHDSNQSEPRSMLTSSRITSGMTSIRRFPHGLRSRSTRLIRRGEHPPLSQVLQLAAAAIAAQLSGQSVGNGEGSRNVGREAFGGSIQNFVQTLQDAASAQAGEDIDLDAAEGDLPPVNFMRVFQFPNDENGSPISPSAHRGSNRSDTDANGTEGDRSVTLVLVGVRSMPNFHDGSTSDSGTVGPSLDTLLGLPFLPPANVLRNGSSGALFRRSDTRTRRSRRHSMTNFSPTAQDEHSHSSSRSGIRPDPNEQPLATLSSSVRTPISESPPGPHPPPSTPADVRSGHATPIRRPSSASAAHPSALPDLEEHDTHMPDAEPTSTSSSTARQRRRSDSEFARRPELGSGAARRNGVVEPDRPPAGVGRSWLIYVVGTNVSPDHPAFTMPSLFTDNPSYEDMQMLSTLLGPVKPPVASRDDVNFAGGTYRLQWQDGVLVAVALDNDSLSNIAIVNGDRCLICLSEYEALEEVRQLNACRHMYHKECIDEWLTTGRNSCPMCRGQGVRENSTSATPATAMGDQQA